MGNAVAPAAPAHGRPYVGCTADAAWHRAGLAEATVFDVYEIGGVLGSGSFGQVRLCWPVHETEEGGKYAVKIVDSKSEVFRQATSFISARQEANILKGVRHPHIVDLIDVFEKDRWLFLVLECITGGELFTALSNPHVAVTEGCVATVGHQLFQALRYLHDQSVVHRDVKAENILLQSNPAKTSRWHIKLIDFGLAMKVEQPACLFRMCKEQEMPLEELICGTAYYCAPEVWVNDYSAKVDVWAAGVVLYLALHGTFPFYDHDAGVLESLICNLDKQPSFQAVCQKDHPDYKISSCAKQTLTALLNKEADLRPSASAALALPWLQPSKQKGSLTRAERSPQLQPRVDWGAGPTLLPGRTSSAASLDSGGCKDFPMECDTIPVKIRAKAGRAAARPPVDPNKEQSRTKALEAMKRRASIGNVGLHSKLEGCSPMSRSSSLADYLRSPVCQSRELGAEAPFERRGLAPSREILSLIESEAAPTESSLSDSDADDGMAVCSCR